MTQNIERELYDWANRMHMQLDLEQVAFMIRKEGTKIKSDAMAKTYIEAKFKRLCLMYYGKEKDQRTNNLVSSEIMRRFPHLPSVDIDFVFNRIADNKTDMNKFFNTSELVGIISRYSANRIKIRRKFFELKSIDKDNKEQQQRVEILIQESLKKFKNKEQLNVYEKSLIGKCHESIIEGANDILESIPVLLPKYAKELRNKQQARESVSLGSFGVFSNLEEEPDEPIYWSEGVLYGFLLFREIEGLDRYSKK